MLEVAAGARPSALADLFRKIWSLGAAGVEIPLTLSRDGATMQLRVRSGDRSDFLFKPRMH